ncbi:hypothetical protein BgAZ_203340 [Babesia gibsoni]|uniref:Non-structural maintenance of chromosomes element 4 n=1 Tax=Babesia gibsoni TaxID=33632 RepID=A0AAD8LL01_BABGI|nr:hypothetical protein BgAZ_203340 [Babesia gibsoni]
MEEAQEAPAKPNQLEEDTDRVTRHEIDEITDNLNFGWLSSFDANTELHSAQNKDEYIISNVASQPCISKALEHGAKLSSIVKAKALRLNEATTLELLDVVLKLYRENFKKGDAADAVSEHQSQEVENSGTPADDSAASNSELDFIELSKFFSTKVLSYSSLSWDILPRVASSLLDASNVKKRKRSQQAPAYHVAPTKELATMVEYKETLETQKHTNIVKDRLLQVAKHEPVKFWEFVLDDTPEQGYTVTCLNIYALTFLTVKGFVKYLEGDDGEILIMGTTESNQGCENSQGIVTGLSYDKWLSMLKRYRRA